MHADDPIVDPTGSSHKDEATPRGPIAPRFGSDVVVAMLKAFEVKYVALNPGASFRGIHDSIVNWGGNREPEIIECCHEEIAVAMAHGYAASNGKPMAAIVHDVVGLQHASIAVYHAWLDRAPVLVLGGTGPMDTARRRPHIEWIHTALVQGDLVRDFTKWDDQPGSVEAIPNSFIRGYQVATSSPPGPVYLCYDVALQESRLDRPMVLPDLRQYPAPTRLQADESVLEELADRLVAAKNPVLIAEFAGRYPNAAAALSELAELLGAPVLGRPGRFNMASNHPLHISGGWDDLIDTADVILAVEIPDLFGLFFTGAGGKPAPGPKQRAWLAHLTLGDLGISSWSQDFQELAPLDCEIRAEAGVVLPRLVGLCRSRMTVTAKAVAARREVVEQRSRALRASWLAEAESTATNRPIALAHLALELRRALEPHPWVVAKGTLQGWLWRLLDVERADQWGGIHVGGGLGTRLGFALGVALDRRDDDVVCVDVQGDGDLLYTPSALWTAAHHRLPILIVVNNNRTYYNSEHHALEIAAERQHSTGNIGIGTRLDDPPTDFAALARSFGVAGAGPIEDPAELLPALQRAVRIVREERRPVLVDVVCANG